MNSNLPDTLTQFAICLAVQFAEIFWYFNGQCGTAGTDQEGQDELNGIIHKIHL